MAHQPIIIDRANEHLTKKNDMYPTPYRLIEIYAYIRIINANNDIKGPMNEFHRTDICKYNNNRAIGPHEL